MKTSEPRTRWLPLLAGLVIPLFLSACSAAAGDQTAESQPDEFISQRSLTFGPGTLVYTDTRAGLAALPGYKAVLNMRFDGTEGGAPTQWSRAYTMLAAQAPQGRQWTVETTQAASAPQVDFFAEWHGLDYERPQDRTCTAMPIQEGDTLTDRFELAAFLTPVIGAEAVGTDIVNGVQADHFTFDGSAFAQQGTTRSTGELWIAADGGYVVSYLLTTQAGPDFFGEGIEGTLTTDYQLTDPGMPVVIQLPEDCPPGLVDAPLLADASNVMNLGGVLSYDSSVSVQDAAAFYRQELITLGWKQAAEPALADSGGTLVYTRNGQKLTLIFSTAERITHLQAVLEQDEEGSRPAG